MLYDKDPLEYSFLKSVSDKKGLRRRLAVSEALHSKFKIKKKILERCISCRKVTEK